jgi:cytochrome c oxidase subunit 2
MTGLPLDYLTSSGSRADGIVALTWFTLVVSILVSVIIAALVWRASIRFHGNGGAAETVAVPVERGGDGFRWVRIGLIISAVPLLVTLVWTMAVLAEVSGPPANPALVIDVTGHQWWWEATYHGAQPSDLFTTANELHIPVGVPVMVKLHGADVIHSFWVPKLAGKTDAIPGQNNLTWLKANAPGRYRGQCTEFCGFQHAKMGFEVVAEPRDAFERWRVSQLQTAPPPATPLQRQGLAVVQYRCGLCHAVRGTEAGSHYGPDLTHLMSRRLIAAGALPNTKGALTGWIQSPQSVKPGTLMPNQHLDASDLIAVSAYLETLK